MAEQTEQAKQKKASQSLAWNASRFFSSLLRFFKVTLDLKKGVDKKGITENIMDDISFVGYNAWILMASIFIASIGLNVNSTAVIIGAMLISPLMGPILGVGLGIGTFDWKMLKDSLKNFGIAIGISLFISWLYFTFTPLQEATPELLNRTRPTLLDVGIAFFGGLAGIIAVSRKEVSNVVPGVAIATALMPPLCTAGYGLAEGDFDLFLNAFYLFLLNSVFICLATFLIIKYLKLPLKQRVDPTKDRRARLLVSIFVLLIIIPSGFLFVDVIRESVFTSRTSAFMEDNFDFEHTRVMNSKMIYSDTVSVIEVFLLGENLTAKRQEDLRRMLPKYKLENVQLKIYQPENASEEIAGRLSEKIRTGIIEDIYRKKEEELHNKDEQISFLEGELVRYKEAEIPFASIVREVKAVFPAIDQLSYARLLQAGGEGTIDTVQTFIVRWNRTEGPEGILYKEQKLTNLLKARLEVDTLQVLRE